MSELLNEVTEVRTEYETVSSIEHSGAVATLGEDPMVQTRMVGEEGAKEPRLLVTFRATLDNGESVMIPVWEPSLEGFEKAVLAAKPITVVELKRREIQILPNGFRQPVREVGSNWRYVAPQSDDLKGTFASLKARLKA
jgi:hypothetical protein